MCESFVAKAFQRIAGLRLSALLLILMPPFSTLASGPFRYVTEFYHAHPPNEELLAGKINGNFDARHPAEVLLAWLHLSGRFNSAHEALFQELWEPRPSGEEIFNVSDFSQALRQERNGTYFYFTTGKAAKRSFVVGTGTQTRYFYYQNCQVDAFDTATGTFNARKQLYGSDSVELNRWIDAQLQVFSHCGGDIFDPPAEPESTWQPLEIQDRQYQIAAAYFYNNRYIEAAERFRAIAADPDSPWQDLGRYLVARSLAREAIINENDVDANLGAALAIYRELAADPEYLAAFPSVTGQIDYLRAQRDPAVVRNDLARHLIESPETADRQVLSELIYLLRPLLSDPEPVIQAASGGQAPLPRTVEEFMLWSAVAVSDSPQSATLALDAWRSTGRVPWLLLALGKAGADADPTLLAELLSAAAEIGPNSLAYFAIVSQRIRLLNAQGNPAQAEALAEAALANDTLDAGQSNQLRLQLAGLSGDWNTYLERAALKPLQLPWTDAFARGLPPETFNIITTGDTLFTRETTKLINDYFTPDMLLPMLDLPGLSPYLRSRLALAGWTRAMLAGDTATALRFSPRIRQLLPRLAGDFLRFENGADKTFEAAWIVLNNPAISPWLWEGVGRLQTISTASAYLTRPAPDYVALPVPIDNWWCKTTLERTRWRTQSTRMFAGDRRFRDLPAERLEAMLAVKLLEETTVAGAFGPYVIVYAPEHLDDPRLPRALHRVVFATHHSCTTGPGPVSQRAFALLHEHFPDSEEASQTPGIKGSDSLILPINDCLYTHSICDPLHVSLSTWVD
ncbi:MAG: hypothetical protein RQ899_00475 [Pseudomonadales bacterium]|nr:hypothetical protein [Pseudomonadales bacterium]